MRGHREPEGQPVSRERKRGKRSRRKRCPGCKCLRTKWLPANNWHAGRVRWVRLVEGGPLVCHVCVTRATEPAVRPGDPVA